MTEQDIAQILMERSDEFKRLKEEHAQLESRLEEIYSNQKYFTPETEVEIKAIKKRKLFLKDRMNEYILKVKKGEMTL